MAVSVEFFCIGNKKEIKGIDDYVENIVSKLKKINIIPAETEFTKPYNDNDIEIDNVYIIDFNVTNEGNDSTWQVVLEFGRFNSILQIKVFICSQNYQLSIDNTYLERLKISIKNSLNQDWEKIVWIKDDDSELLSISLYPYLYKAENLTRQLINEVMSKKYGIDWWDNYIPERIKNKHKSRIKGYKSAVPTFANVDERLMSIDIGDLCDIFSLKNKIWNPQPNKVISAYLNDRIDVSKDEIKKILTCQSVESEDFWSDVFAQYLTDDFKEHFKRFELNRNHVMHNKLIDRSAYKMIEESVNTVIVKLQSAISESQKRIMSAEQLVDIEKKHEAVRIEHELLELEVMQSEAGVNILDNEEILEIFDEKLQEFYWDFKETMHFRRDIDISNSENVTNDNGRHLFFSITYKITEDILNVYYEFNMLDISQGAISEVTIYFVCNDKKYAFPVRYINGEGEYNYYQGNYIPITNDMFYDSDIDNIMVQLQDFINENFTDMRAYVDANIYSIVKDGGRCPVSDNVICFECYEKYICIDGDYGKFGQCLNCGETNEICKCCVCECYCEGVESDDEMNYCENCKERFEKNS